MGPEVERLLWWSDVCSLTSAALCCVVVGLNAVLFVRAWRRQGGRDG